MDKHTIKTVDDRTLKVDRFIAWGNDIEAFALCGKDLYSKGRDECYFLFKKDFKEGGDAAE